MRLVLFSLPLLVGARASAQASPHPEARIVDLVFVGDAIEASGLSPVIDELLGRVEVQVRRGPLALTLDPREVLTPRDDAPDALARIWIEIGPERATIYLVDGQWERILVRHIPSEGPSLGEVGREEVAHIVHAAVEALLDGARIGLTAAEARRELGVEDEVGGEVGSEVGGEVGGEVEHVEHDSPPRVEPADVPSAPGEVAGDVYIGYGPALFSDGPSVRHAVMVYGALLLGTATTRPVISIGLDFWPPSSHQGAGVRLDLRSVVVRVALGADLAITENTAIRVHGGIALDITNASPEGLPGSPVRGASTADLAGPLLTLRAAVHRRVFEWLALTAAFLLDVDLLDARYVVDAGERDIPVVDPWVVRPGLFVGVGGSFR